MLKATGSVFASLTKNERKNHVYAYACFCDNIFLGGRRNFLRFAWKMSNHYLTTYTLYWTLSLNIIL